jgi:hypothetical protein
MYSNFHYEMAKARVADIHEEIQRDVMGRAARKGRRAQKSQSARPAPRFPVVVARRILTMLGAPTLDSAYQQQWAEAGPATSA